VGLFTGSLSFRLPVLPLPVSPVVGIQLRRFGLTPLTGPCQSCCRSPCFRIFSNALLPIEHKKEHEQASLYEYDWAGCKVRHSRALRDSVTQTPPAVTALPSRSQERPEAGGLAYEKHPYFFPLLTRFSFAVGTSGNPFVRDLLLHRPPLQTVFPVAALSQPGFLAPYGLTQHINVP